MPGRRRGPRSPALRQARTFAADGLIPYLDYTTPTFYDDISGGVQRLMAAKDTPAQFAKSMQSVYDKWDSSR